MNVLSTNEYRYYLPRILFSSWTWHLTRWDGLFMGSYLVTHLGGRPIDNQLVGIGMFAPMLLGAAVSNRIRNGLNPRQLVLVTELVLLPISVLMTVLAATGAVQIPMVYPFMLAYGFGGMVNMTAQRELLFRLAGPARADRVLNMEMAGLASAIMLGPLVGGVTIDLFGLGAAFGLLVFLLGCSTLVFWRTTVRLSVIDALKLDLASLDPAVLDPVVFDPVVLDPLTVPLTEAPASSQGEQGWRLLSRSPALVVVLAVTVVANLCYFAFIPLVPVIAKNLGAGAAMAGVIGATAGTVQLFAATALVAWPARRPGAAYAFGVALCLLCLGVLSYAPTIAIALLSLGVAGIGQALFGTMQATLPVAAVTPQERSAALGLLSTTIGVALPTGMLVLGVSSNLLGSRLAMLVSSLVGMTALAVVVLRNPQLLVNQCAEQVPNQRAEQRL